MSRNTTSEQSSDRRTRLRLRELCDEVIASHRIAAGRDPIDAGDRREAERLLAGLTPLARA